MLEKSEMRTADRDSTETDDVKTFNPDPTETDDNRQHRVWSRRWGQTNRSLTTIVLTGNSLSRQWASVGVVVRPTLSFEH